MSQRSALDGLRVGCVQYLNSKPLIYGLHGVRLAHPSVLAAELRRGELDAALVPVFEVLRSPEAYWAVDGVAIASRGAVYSVFVAHRGPLEEMESVVVDPASLTSVHLVQVLFQGIFGRRIRLLEDSAPGEMADNAGRLLIGNQAIAFRQEAEGRGWKFWDLGEAWTRWTGLPFVYALWVIRRGTPGAAEAAGVFRQIARAGAMQIDSIAAGETEVDRGLARTYLREYISFELGELEKKGLVRFMRELERFGFLSGVAGGIEFISEACQREGE